MPANFRGRQRNNRSRLETQAGHHRPSRGRPITRSDSQRTTSTNEFATKASPTSTAVPASPVPSLSKTDNLNSQKSDIVPYGKMDANGNLNPVTPVTLRKDSSSHVSSSTDTCASVPMADSSQAASTNLGQSDTTERNLSLPNSQTNSATVQNHDVSGAEHRQTSGDLPQKVENGSNGNATAAQRESRLSQSDSQSEISLKSDGMVNAEGRSRSVPNSVPAINRHRSHSRPNSVCSDETRIRNGGGGGGGGRGRYQYGQQYNGRGRRGHPRSRNGTTSGGQNFRRDMDPPRPPPYGVFPTGDSRGRSPGYQRVPYMEWPNGNNHTPMQGPAASHVPQRYDYNANNRTGSSRDRRSPSIKSGLVSGQGNGRTKWDHEYSRSLPRKRSFGVSDYMESPNACGAIEQYNPMPLPSGNNMHKTSGGWSNGHSSQGCANQFSFPPPQWTNGMNDSTRNQLTGTTEHGRHERSSRYDQFYQRPPADGSNHTTENNQRVSQPWSSVYRYKSPGQNVQRDHRSQQHQQHQQQQKAFAGRPSINMQHRSFKGNDPADNVYGNQDITCTMDQERLSENRISPRSQSSITPVRPRNDFVDERRAESVHAPERYPEFRTHSRLPYACNFQNPPPVTNQNQAPHDRTNARYTPEQDQMLNYAIPSSEDYHRTLYQAPRKIVKSQHVDSNVHAEMVSRNGSLSQSTEGRQMPAYLDLDSNNVVEYPRWSTGSQEAEFNKVMEYPRRSNGSQEAEFNNVTEYPRWSNGSQEAEFNKVMEYPWRSNGSQEAEFNKVMEYRRRSNGSQEAEFHKDVEYPRWGTGSQEVGLARSTGSQEVGLANDRPLLNTNNTYVYKKITSSVPRSSVFNGVNDPEDKKIRRVVGNMCVTVQKLRQNEDSRPGNKTQTLNPRAESFKRIRDEINEEMARAQSMSIPVNVTSKRESEICSDLNPEAVEFAPTLMDNEGNFFNMVNEKGCYFFRKVVPSNPEYVIRTESERYSQINTPQNVVVNANSEVVDSNAINHGPGTNLQAHDFTQVVSNATCESIAYQEQPKHFHNREVICPSLYNHQEVQSNHIQQTNLMHPIYTCEPQAPVTGIAPITTVVQHAEMFMQYSNALQHPAMFVTAAVEQSGAHVQHVPTTVTNQAGPLSITVPQVVSSHQQIHGPYSNHAISIQTPHVNAPSPLAAIATPMLANGQFHFFPTAAQSVPVSLHTPAVTQHAQQMSYSAPHVIVTQPLHADSANVPQPLHADSTNVPQPPVLNLHALYTQTQETACPSHEEHIVGYALDETPQAAIFQTGFPGFTTSLYETQIDFTSNDTKSSESSSALSSCDLRHRVDEVRKLIRDNLNSRNADVSNNKSGYTAVTAVSTNYKAVGALDISANTSACGTANCPENAHCRIILEKLRRMRNNGGLDGAMQNVQTVPENVQILEWLKMFTTVLDLEEKGNLNLTIDKLAELMKVLFRDRFYNRKTTYSSLESLQHLLDLSAGSAAARPGENVTEKFQALSIQELPQSTVSPSAANIRQEKLNIDDSASSGKEHSRSQPALVASDDFSSRDFEQMESSFSTLTEATNTGSAPSPTAPKTTTEETTETSETTVVPAAQTFSGGTPPTESSSAQRSSVANDTSAALLLPTQAEVSHTDSVTETNKPKSSDGPPEMDSLPPPPTATSRTGKQGHHHRRGSLSNVNIEGRISYFEKNGHNKFKCKQAMKDRI